MNSVNLVGRMTKDIVLKEYDKNKKETGLIGRFTMAVNRNKEHTDFISCVCFDGTAEVIDQYMKKGSLIGISGSIQTGSYKNKDGNTIYTTEVLVSRIDFCESKAKAKDDDFVNGDDNPWDDEEEEEQPKRITKSRK